MRISFRYFFQIVPAPAIRISLRVHDDLPALGQQPPGHIQRPPVRTKPFIKPALRGGKILKPRRDPDMKRLVIQSLQGRITGVFFCETVHISSESRSRSEVKNGKAAQNRLTTTGKLVIVPPFLLKRLIDQTRKPAAFFMQGL